ncbi:hypothetical protein AB6A40_009314 [Gnathostoma spinigerum]|uniref:Uncharacterized protein n=1 Tax=Gnathostoma spinigerum TaxID=75299 RepID=A0ABD6F1E0_9BILA
MLAGKVALVTGASRGIGKGIAMRLGKAGATVFITGRPPKTQERGLARMLQLPTLEETAEEITHVGGKGIAIYCDHSKDDEVKEAFEHIAHDTDDRLDILVNNAYSAVTTITRLAGVKFYKTDVKIFDEVNRVGLRNHYLCSIYAARLMDKRHEGLIVTVSSGGGLRYLFNTAYGVGKSACDRLAADMAHDLYDSNIASVSLWPGPVKTELVKKTVLKEGGGANKEDQRVGRSHYKDVNSHRRSAERAADHHNIISLFDNGESVDFAGKCVVALATDPNIMKKTGHVLTTTGLAKEYGLFEDDGVTQPNDPLLKGFEDYIAVCNKIRSPGPDFH